MNNNVSQKNMKKNIVVLDHIKSYKIDVLKDFFKTRLADLGAYPILLKSKNITIKINLCDARPPETGAITHPVFLDAFLDYLRETFGWDKTINVVESEGTVAIPDLFIKWFGFDKIFKKWNVNYVNLSTAPVIQKKVDGFWLKKIQFPEIFLKTDFFVSMAKLKTNILTSITCCLKNLFGCLPIVKKSVYHPVIDLVIADVAKVFKPDLCIIDGIVGMGGAKGPSYGKTIKSNIVIMGTDSVACDAVASRVMGLNPRKIAHIKNSQKLGVGSFQNINLIVDGKVSSKIPIMKEYTPSILEEKALKFAIKLQSSSRIRRKK